MNALLFASYMNRALDQLSRGVITLAEFGDRAFELTAQLDVCTHGQVLGNCFTCKED